jgi:hypothetical protein
LNSNSFIPPDPAPDASAGKITRREALRLVAAVTATISILPPDSFGAAGAAAKPYGTDPLLNKTYQAGDLWPLTLTPSQKATVKALADLILPADDKSPAASEVGAVEFIDEWISAPYEIQQNDRAQILEGIGWLDREAQKRFARNFAVLALPEKSAVADDICFVGRAKPELEVAALFFAKFRMLVAGGYYATRKGWQDLGYVGNIPLAKFDGPPKAVREKLGLN